MTTRKLEPGKPYPFYSIKELSELIGMSVSGTRRFLYRMNVPLHLSGKKIIVYMSDIQNQQPELFNSILEAAHLNRLIVREEEANPEDYAVRDQFE